MTENLPKPDTPVLLWFRFDLRLQDQPAVSAAIASERPIIPVYIWDEHYMTRPLGAASKWWLGESLKALNEDLRQFESRLIIARGHTQIILASLANELAVKTIYCTQTFDPVAEASDCTLRDELKAVGIALERTNAALLSPPNTVRTQDGRPFRVFTPFYKSLQAAGYCDPPTLAGLSPKPWPAPAAWPDSLDIGTLELAPAPTPSGKDWSAGFTRFIPGERGARKALRSFLRNGLGGYDNDRDRPDLDATSHLSPHLRFGEISPQRILAEAEKAVIDTPALAASAAKFRSELAWREFSYGLLHQQPRLHEINFRSDFDGFPWHDDDAGFRAWCRGETGYELVDAGMRELWQTGYMHNRVRMVAASFLVKHLLIDWRRGEQWFWDCLLDADPANNPASWQWVAGCGADAAPYFRVFNPMTQAEKFDPNGLYRQHYIPGYTPLYTGLKHSRIQPELFDVVPKKSPQFTYPQPIVEHAFARQRALEAYTSRGAADHDDAD